jgi:hypothetical protein
VQTCPPKVKRGIASDNFCNRSMCEYCAAMCVVQVVRNTARSNNSIAFLLLTNSLMFLGSGYLCNSLFLWIYTYIWIHIPCIYENIFVYKIVRIHYILRGNKHRLWVLYPFLHIADWHVE